MTNADFSPARSYSLSKGDVMDFVRANKEGLFISDQGFHDYLAMRCLVLNGLLTEGYVMAGQAIEKLLKGQYRLRGGSAPFKSLSHNIPKIETKLREECGIDLRHYSSLMGRMAQEYENRYPDNMPASWKTDGADIDLLDELVLFLFENLPVPQELRLSSQYFGVLYNNRIKPDHCNNKIRWRWHLQLDD